MIPPIFARAVEKDIWVLGICADYLEDHGKDGSVLRIIADNHFLLDESGCCSGYKFCYDDSFFYGDGDNCGNGNGDGSDIFDDLSTSIGYYLHGTDYGDGDYEYGNHMGNGTGRSNDSSMLWL